MGFSNVIVEFDTLIKASFLTTLSRVHPILSFLVDGHRSLLRMIPQMEVSHLFSEANRCVIRGVTKTGWTGWIDRNQTKYVV